VPVDVSGKQKGGLMRSIHDPVPRSGCRDLLRRGLGALLLLLLSLPAWARFDCESDTQGGSGTTIALDAATIVVGRDAEAGDLVGQWMTYSDSSAFGCAFLTAIGETVDVGVAATPQQTLRGTVSADDGNTYAVYAGTNYYNLGLGYIVRWRTMYEGETTDWQVLTSEGDTKQASSATLGTISGTSSDDDWLVGLEVQVHYVMLSSSLTAGTVTVASGDMVRFNVDGSGTVEGLLTITSYSYEDDISSNDRKMMSQAASTLTIESGGTCSTPDVAVELPAVSLDVFAGVGTVAALQSFELDFQDCPAGLNSVGYSFAAVTSVLDESNGVLELDSSSTATGLGIQLMDEEGTPLAFDSVYNLDSYDTSAVASYTVPLQAAIYQTESTVTAGEVSTSLTFTLEYK
jgi:major type 1 subunit fimbrin (pilin)